MSRKLNGMDLFVISDMNLKGLSHQSLLIILRDLCICVFVYSDEVNFCYCFVIFFIQKLNFNEQLANPFLVFRLFSTAAEACPTG